MDGINSIPSMMAQETEILLAKIATESISAPMVFEEKISTIDPLMLYGACLTSIEYKFHDFEHKEINPILDFIHFTRLEKQKLQESGEVPVPIPELTELFRLQD
jgi:hypothetical protein